MGKRFFQSKRFWVGIVFIVTWLSYYATGEKTFQEILATKDFLIGIEGFVLWLISLTSGNKVSFGGRTIFGGKLD